VSIDELIRQASLLPPDEQLRLAAHLVESARKQYPAYLVYPHGNEIQGSAPDPLVGQNTQEWVSQTRIAERKPGLHPGSFIVHDDFDEPLPDSFWLGEA
jgi:hypothetical protein